jgi:hypothetical protein
LLPEAEQVHLSQDELAALEVAEVMACQSDQDWLLTSGKLKIITKKFQMVDLDLNSEQAKLLAMAAHHQIRADESLALDSGGLEFGPARGLRRDKGGPGRHEVSGAVGSAGRAVL